MLTLFREGGYSMFFVLGFGFVSLAWAALYAARGKKRPLGFIIGMMAATLFATASGICGDFGATFENVAHMAESPNPQIQAMARDPLARTSILIEGAGESMAPGIMGFSLLALTALLLAVGSARVQREPADA